MTVSYVRLKTALYLGLMTCLSWLLMTTPVSARGGCFASGTHILTPDGAITIEQLHVGDRIIGLNLENHQLEPESIGNIQVVESPEYYIINDTITVTGSHPFYVQTETGLKLTQVENLSIGDQLIGLDGFTPVVSSIHHHSKPITVYNLISVTPHHNFYAEEVLVHNKGGGGGGGGGGRTRGGGGIGVPINEKTIPSLIISSVILLSCLLPTILWREFYNTIRFFGKHFSEDADLIAFAQQVNPRFNNRYDMSYWEDYERWESDPLLPELEVADYEDVIERADLVDQVSQIFVQYQTDWTNKKFDDMADYTTASFHRQQEPLFRKEFRYHYDIVYQPKIEHLVPVSIQQSEAEEDIITVQIIASVTNFEVSVGGRVLSGEPYPRTFTEYWDIVVDSQKSCRLMNIGYVPSSDSPAEGQSVEAFESST